MASQLSCALRGFTLSVALCIMLTSSVASADLSVTAATYRFSNSSLHVYVNSQLDCTSVVTSGFIMYFGPDKTSIDLIGASYKCATQTDTGLVITMPPEFQPLANGAGLPISMDVQANSFTSANGTANSIQNGLSVANIDLPIGESPSPAASPSVNGSSSPVPSPSVNGSSPTPVPSPSVNGSSPTPSPVASPSWNNSSPTPVPSPSVNGSSPTPSPSVNGSSPTPSPVASPSWNNSSPTPVPSPVPSPSINGSSPLPSPSVNGSSPTPSPVASPSVNGSSPTPVPSPVPSPSVNGSSPTPVPSPASSPSVNGSSPTPVPSPVSSPSVNGSSPTPVPSPASSPSVNGTSPTPSPSVNGTNNTSPSPVAPPQSPSPSPTPVGPNITANTFTIFEEGSGFFWILYGNDTEPLLRSFTTPKPSPSPVLSPAPNGSANSNNSNNTGSPSPKAMNVQMYTLVAEDASNNEWPNAPNVTFSTRAEAEKSINDTKNAVKNPDNFVYDKKSKQLILYSVPPPSPDAIELAYLDHVANATVANKLTKQIQKTAAKAPVVIDVEPSPSPAPSGPGKKGLKTWQIVLIVGGGVVVLGVLAFIFSSRSKKHSLADDLHGPLLHEDGDHHA